MPNIITHKIFAEEVLKSMTKHDIRSMIERHPQIFYIGSNGPDFLFFSDVYKRQEFTEMSDTVSQGAYRK